MIRSPDNFKLAAVAALVGVGLGLFASCYQSPFVAGWYRCDSNDGCGSGQVCDDGVCCSAEGSPVCPTLVRADGSCPDGGVPLPYFQDLDHDGYGTGDAQLFCAQPVTMSYVLDAGDCLDTPNFGETSYPGAPELCDGLDNDCNGVPDNGLDGGTYYFDQDNDGYGDPNNTRTLCAATSGWVTSGNDCDPTHATAHPGGTEVCDGLDNDCNGMTDDTPTDTGGPCTAADAGGICMNGRIGCASGELFCRPGAPKREICDTLDNNCNGSTDERPFCGGPSNLLSASSASIHAYRFAGTSNPGYTTCQSTSGLTGQTWSGGTWGGDNAVMHLLTIDAVNGETWDLTKPKVALHADFTVTMVRQANPAWAAFGQPVFLFCPGTSTTAPCTRIRWWGGTGSNTALMGAGGGGSYTIDVPLDGSSSKWTVAQAGALDNVGRIEVFVQPEYNGTLSPHFDIHFNSLGFTVLP